MKKNTLYLMMIGLTLSMLLLNGLLFHVFKCSEEYLQTKNVWGNLSSIRRTDYLHQQQILRSMSRDPEVESHLLQYMYPEEYADHSPSDKPLRISDSDYASYWRLSKYLQKIRTYDQYILSIRKNSENISSVFLPLSMDSWYLKNLVQCEKDYSGLEFLKLTPTLDDGINLVIQYHVTDFMAFFLLASLSLLLYVYLRSQTFLSSGTPLTPFLATGLLGGLGCVALYLSNLCILEQTLGLPALNIPLQSLESFYSCQYAVTLGGFLAFWILFKLTVCLLLLFVCILVFSSRKSLFFGAVACGLLLTEYAVSLCSEKQSALIPLREINLFSGFTFERFFNRYLNLNIQNRLFPRMPLFLILFAIFFLILLILSYTKIHRFLTRNTLALQQVYFEEIDNRYRETRRLWHDFNNHLLAVKALYNSGNVAEAEKYIDELTEQSKENLLPAKTGSNAVDLLLFQKYQQCLSLDCSLEITTACNLKKHNIRDYDLCSLLGNLLDNAVEACRSLSPEKSLIQLRMEEMGSMLYISCQNPYEGARREQGGQLYTTKQDAKNHGIGLYSVKQICKKYAGSLEIGTEENRFLVELLLNDRK